MVDQLDVEARPSISVPARPRRWGLAIGAAACTAAVLVSHKSAPPALTVTLILIATALSIELARREGRVPGDVRPVGWTIAGLWTVAVIRPPRFGTDIWSYTVVGRMLESHHLNPYRTAPVDLAHEPMMRFLHHTWSTGTTPYGPLFVVHSAFVSLFSGTSPLLYRLSFQLLAALAMAIVLWLLWRETHSTAAVALVGLNPEVAGSIVNAGHNDALLALGLLGTVLLLARGRSSAAGWVLCATVLVKLTIGFAVLPLLLWTATRLGRRAMLRLVAPTICLAVPLLFLVGALHSMAHANSGVVTRLSIWNTPQRISWLGLTHHPPITYTTAGTAAAVAISAFAAFVGRRQRDPGRGAAAASAGWLVGAGYVLAWYSVLGLAVAALRPADRLARWLAVQGGLITAAFLVPSTSFDTVPGLRRVIMFWIPLALLVGFVWAMVPLVADARRLRREALSRTSSTATA